MQNVLHGIKTNVETEVCNNPFHGHYLTRNRKRSWNDPSYTIVATDSHIPLHPSGKPMIKVGKDHWALQGDLNRRLSWRECAVIQGFPIDRLNFDSPLTQKYKVIGNAVPPHFGYAIVKPVVEYENNVMLPATYGEAFMSK